MKRGSCSFIVGMILLPAIASAGPAARVSNGNDSGPGSLRAALTSGATEIVIKPGVDVIDLEAPLYYSGTAALTIRGTGQTIDGFGLGDEPILTIVDGADLRISGLTFDAGGGDAHGPWQRLVNEGGGNAIYVDVPDDATGVVTVELEDLVVRGTGNHGIHISDCVLEGGDSDSCGDGNTGEGEGSAASIVVRASGVLIEESGFGTQDADGLRVDERGPGDVTLFVTNSTFMRVGADGIELDEGGPGDVIIDVRNTGFIENGEYCLIGEFIEGDDCDDDGDPDVDDGFDIDEAGDGSLRGRLANVQVILNYDEGLDFDEAGMGDTDLEFVNITGIDNEDESIKVSEEDPGDNIARLAAISETGDLEFEESGMGSVHTTLSGSSIGDDYKFVEEDDGIADIVINGSTVADTLEIESDDGDPATIDAFVRARGSEIGEIEAVEGTVIEQL
jgi:hypothetical protein